ncbi:MAG: hypothetical protein ACTSQY_07860 [Candidatus Odinarchaeia archaeon]
MEHTFQQLVRTIVEDIKSKFKIPQLQKTPKVVIEKKKNLNEQDKEKSVSLKKDKLIIVSGSWGNTFFNEFLISELSKLFFPEILRTVKRSIDISYFIAYKLSSKKKEWLRKWSTISKTIFLKNITYKPIYDYIEIDKVTDGTAIKKIFDFFEKIGKFKTSLSLEEYLFFFDAFQKSIIIRLSENEYKILSKIVEGNELILSKIAKELNMSEDFIYKKYYKLKRHIWLNYLAFINWPKIGLEFFLILINPINKFIEYIKQKIMNPYARVLHQLGGGEGSKLLITCAVPYGTNYVLEDIMKDFKKDGYIFDYEIIRPTSYNHTINIEKLDIRKNIWQLHPQTIREYLISEEYKSLNVDRQLFFDFSYKKLKEIDRLDVELLFTIESPPGIEISINQLSKKLKAPKNLIYEKLIKLKNEKFFKGYWTFHPTLINLPENLFIIAYSRTQEVVRRIEFLITKLPNSHWMEIDNGYGIIAVISLPGEINNISNTIAEGIMELEGLTDLNVFFEHINYRKTYMASKLFNENGWVHPKELWS